MSRKVDGVDKVCEGMEACSVVPNQVLAVALITACRNTAALDAVGNSLRKHGVWGQQRVREAFRNQARELA